MLVPAWAGVSTLSLIGIGITACCCQQQQQQQQQQVVVDDNGEAKRVCPECGMENPREAKHCGDCGFSFGKGTEGDDGDE